MQPAGIASGETMEMAARHALRIAAAGEGRMVFRGEGESMQPFFGNGSFLLARETEYERLSVGMIVIYREDEGSYVAHRLQAQNGDGWQAKGQNNRHADRETITAENFVGIVYAVIHSSGLGASDSAWFGEIPVALGKSN